MALIFRMNDTNFNIIHSVSQKRWEGFLLRQARYHNSTDEASAVGRMREVIASTTCRSCMAQYALERGLIKMIPDFYECPTHGSASLAKFPRDESIFRIRDILRERDVAMKDEDWEIAQILLGVKCKLDADYE
jgi:hypothetical protein